MARALDKVASRSRSAPCTAPPSKLRTPQPGRACHSVRRCVCRGTCLARGGTRPAALRGTPSYCVGCFRGSENVGGNTWLSLQGVVFRINRDVVVDQGQLLQSWTDRGRQNFVPMCSPLGMSSRVKPARRFAAVLGGPNVCAGASSALFYRLRPDCAVSLPASASAPPCARSSSTCANQVAQPGPFNFRHAPWPRRLQEPRPAAHTLHTCTHAQTQGVSTRCCVAQIQPLQISSGDPRRRRWFCCRVLSITEKGALPVFQGRAQRQLTLCAVSS